MKIDYGPTLEQLRRRNLVEPDDILLLCSEAPSNSAAFFGGAIGAAISNAGKGHIVMAVNENRISVFDIDKKTGQYLETMARFDRDKLKKVTFSTFLSAGINIRGEGIGENYVTGKKFNGYEQRQAFDEAFALLKTSYKNLK